MESGVDIWLNSQVLRGSFAPLDQLHKVRPEDVNFTKEGFVEVTEGEKKLLLPWHKIDCIEIS